MLNRMQRVLVWQLVVLVKIAAVVVCVQEQVFHKFQILKVQKIIRIIL